MSTLRDHCLNVADAARDGEVVFLLGAGVNMCGRPAEIKWEPGCGYLPTGRELGDYLAVKYRAPQNPAGDLARIAEWVTAQRGPARLSKELHELFDVECAPTAIHQLLARLPKLLEAERCPLPHQFIVTTNYDDVLERAFREAGVAFDLLVYIAHGRDSGRVRCHPHDGSPPYVIYEPNKDAELGTHCSVILKMHGAVDRENGADSWVITEEDYVDYLTQTDISQWLPSGLGSRLKQSNIECLGYSLRDWNVRAILRRMRKELPDGWNWWAVQLESEDIDRWVWSNQGLAILDARLEQYVDALDAALAERVAVVADG